MLLQRTRDFGMRRVNDDKATLAFEHPILC